MRPSMALRANCVCPACVVCTLPNTSPESASNAWRAPSAVWLSTAMTSGLDGRTCVERARNRLLISGLRRRGKAEAGPPVAPPFVASVRKTSLGS